jgi:integrase
LRHSAATALLVMGEDSRVLMGVMGWTSMSLVQRYMHIVPELRRGVAQRQAVLWASD